MVYHNLLLVCVGDGLVYTQTRCIKKCVARYVKYHTDFSDLCMSSKLKVLIHLVLHIILLCVFCYNLLVFSFFSHL